ncbi:glycine oxidase ThiO [Bacillus altitudinis]|uniref:glycine oxidase ThiO n=1 Tax=Bacillus altitudinis TaxID=293387 RepID=UPI002021D601|nr:glycine oxidase ThiO [Bacillus altitudinis]MCL7872306.1 glycine oxidase ThiO [Bacillus altitudinis]
MNKHYDVAIIGGGIIGMSIAYHLAKAGKQIVLFEANEIGKQTTSAAAGMLGAHAEGEGDEDIFFQVGRQSQALYEKLTVDLQHESGIDIRTSVGGIMKVAFTEQEKRALCRMQHLPTFEWLEASSVKERMPQIADDIVGAGLIADDVHVEPYAVCRAFWQAAVRHGADVKEFTPVIDVKRGKETLTVSTAKGIFTCDHLTVASGVWSGRFLEELGLSHSLYPVKGECVSVWNNGLALAHTIYHDHCYIVQRDSGKLVIGATMKPNDWQAVPTLGGIEAVIHKASQLMPSIREMPIDQCWAGLRPATSDRHPYIGKHPEDERILFATGHYRNGILLAPITGEIIRGLIAGESVHKEWLHAFRIGRKEALFV